MQQTTATNRPADANGQSIGLGALRAAASSERLSERDREFAGSMADGWDRYGSLTPRQRPHAIRLIAASTAPAPPRARSIGDFAPMLAMFTTAREHIRNPKLRIRNEAGRILMLSVAKEGTREPGTINVVDKDGTWYGRIRADGTFAPSHRDAPSAATVAALHAFAAAPAQTARAYGRDTGECCCCGRMLTDPRSISSGIGPVCAARFGLE
jgi:hypothetical protein